MLDRDIEENRVKKPGSHTRNLLRVKRGLEMVKVLFEQILAAEYVYQNLNPFLDSSLLILWTSISSLYNFIHQVILVFNLSGLG